MTNGDVNVDELKRSNKISATMISVICCTFVCVIALITVVFIVNQNNKKMAMESAKENAIERIDKLVENVYSVENYYDSNYSLAKDDLLEIKTLIEDNNIDGLPVTKYNKANTYMNDLKTAADIYGLYEKVNGNKEAYVKQACSLFKKITTEKVLNDFCNSGDLIASLGEAVKSIILGRAFYAAQKHFIENYPDCTLLNVSEFNPSAYISSNYTVIGVNYANEISMYGLERIVNNEKDCSEYEWINTEMLASAVETIKSNGGYAIVVNYFRNDENQNTLYPYTRSYWWYVGIDVSADLIDGDLKFNITKHIDGKIEEKAGLDAYEVLDYSILNPA